MMGESQLRESDHVESIPDHLATGPGMQCRESQLSKRGPLKHWSGDA